MKTVNFDKLTIEYTKVIAKEKAIAEEKKILGEEIKEGLKKMNLTSATTKLGIFAIVVQSVWGYSKKVSKLEEQLSVLKEAEKKNGIARKTPSSESVRFTPKN